MFTNHKTKHKREKKRKMVKPHILALPFPAQGHVIPMMELSQCLVSHGFKVTFVNTDYNHKRVLKAMSDTCHLTDQIRLVSIPDGMEPWEDRNDLGKLLEATRRVMAKKLEELVNKINSNSRDDDADDEMIICVIADETFGWALEMAEKMMIKRVAFWPASAALLALAFSIPTLLRDGIIDSNGVPLRNQIVQLTPEMPATKTEHLVWACIGDEATRRLIFHTMSRNNTIVKLADWILCNSSSDLEPSAFSLAPQIKPIGPMFAGNNRLRNNSEGNFWAHDTTCLEWLDKQPPLSVIYVAFGSFTVFDQTQFNELALGLELSNRPFLWVVREDLIGDDCDAKSKDYPDGFLERIESSNGKIVSWSPQQKVLSHPSVACFLSHCGWNSTVEGVTNGVPFLCWPYFADQFLNESYLCDVWKCGLRFEKDESGIIRRGEIKKKVDRLLGDEGFRERVLKVKDLAVDSGSEAGKSYVVFKNFVEWAKS